jgi:hypothetical protein
MPEVNMDDVGGHLFVDNFTTPGHKPGVDEASPVEETGPPPEMQQPDAGVGDAAPKDG